MFLSLCSCYFTMSLFQVHVHFLLLACFKLPFTLCFVACFFEFLCSKLSHHSYKQSQTKLVHPYSLRASQRYQEHGMKRHGLQELCKDNKSTAWSTMIWESFAKLPRAQHEAPWFGRSQRVTNKNKTNYICFIYRLS